MGQLMVVTTPDLAPGFQLAGVEIFVAEGPEQAEATLGNFWPAIRPAWWSCVEAYCKVYLPR
jgi:hypothetical protein